MPKAPYAWNSDTGKSAIIQPHSIAKHDVLHDYLVRYINVLASNPSHSHLRLSLIDGFAGGGIYRRWDNDQEHEGSPLIMLRAVHYAVDEINQHRNKKLEIEPSFVFVEKDLHAFQSLKRVIEERDVPFRPRITLHHGEFSVKVNTILNEIKEKRQERAIFLLDQYGYSDVPMNTIRAIFSSVPKAEVILTFSVDALIDYYPKKGEYTGLLNIGLEHNISDDSSPQSYASLRMKKKAEIIREIHSKSGALFYTPFFIRSHTSPRGYWFIHLFNHFRARDEMMRLHWAMHTHFIHHGGSGLDMLAYDPGLDSKVTGQKAFLFDELAQCQSIEQLNEDIPRYVFNEIGRQGVTFEKFLLKKFNDTPAHADMIKGVIGEAIRSKDLLVRGEKGEKRQSGNAIKSTDIIFPNPQLKLKFD